LTIVREGGASASQKPCNRLQNFCSAIELASDATRRGDFPPTLFGYPAADSPYSANLGGDPRSDSWCCLQLPHSNMQPPSFVLADDEEDVAPVSSLSSSCDIARVLLRVSMRPCQFGVVDLVVVLPVDVAATFRRNFRVKLGTISCGSLLLDSIGPGCVASAAALSQ